MFCKKGVLRNFTKFTGKHLCQCLFFKETLAQVFSCEFCEISKNTFFYRTAPVATSVNIKSEALLETSTDLFSDSKVNITTEGKWHLGAAIGSNNSKENMLPKKLTNGVKN